MTWTWSSTTEHEISDEEYQKIEEASHHLESYPDHMLEEVDSSTAELVDWDYNAWDLKANTAR